MSSPIVSFSQAQAEHLERMKRESFNNRSHARDRFRCSLKDALANSKKWKWDSYGTMAEILVYPSIFLLKRDVMSIVAEYRDVCDFRLFVIEKYSGFGSNYIVLGTSSRWYQFQRVLLNLYLRYFSSND